MWGGNELQTKPGSGLDTRARWKEDPVQLTQNLFNLKNRKFKHKNKDINNRQHATILKKNIGQRKLSRLYYFATLLYSMHVYTQEKADISNRKEGHMKLELYAWAKCSWTINSVATPSIEKGDHN